MSKQILLVTPSAIVARGLEQVFRDLGEFDVCGILTDLSGGLRGWDADAVIVDPEVVDFASRSQLKVRISDSTDAAVLVLASPSLEEEVQKQFDGAIGLYDAPTTIIRKVREALEGHSDVPKSEGEGLSLREKEILICVAKGMLNKEIADLYNISIHTVITHRKNITRKTGIKTVAGLTVYALLNNLIDMNSIE